MMDFKQAIKEIEDVRFSIRLNVVSDLWHLLNAAGEEASIKELFVMLDSAMLQKQLVNRILMLASQRIDVRYEHPHDLSMCIYLWLLSRKNVEFATLAAQQIIETPQCWWAKQFSKMLLFVTVDEGTTKPMVRFFQSGIATDAQDRNLVVESIEDAGEIRVLGRIAGNSIDIYQPSYICESQYDLATPLLSQERSLFPKMESCLASRDSG